MIDLSLLVAYRNRPDNLTSLLDWFDRCRINTDGELELIIVESEMYPSEVLLNEKRPYIKYRHIKENGAFNKSKWGIQSIPVNL